MSLGTLCVSVLCIYLTCTLAYAARWLVEKCIKRPFVKTLFLEALAGAELCGCCFELIIVADNFGVTTYAVFLFILTIWWSQQWGDATACPYLHLEDVVEGRSEFRKAALITWAELTGGICVWRYVHWIWSMELSETHEGRAFEDCSADLQVPMLYGFIIEAVATCLCRIFSRALSDSNVHFAPVMDSFIGTTLVVAAFNYSGGYFNPVLATSLKWGCDGHTLIEHMVVYWIGACSGSIISTYVYKMPEVQKLLLGKAKVA